MPVYPGPAASPGPVASPGPAAEPSIARARLLAHLADLVPTPQAEDAVRVGIDGPDGAGKTVLARELTAELDRRGRPVVQVSLDGFHRVRAERYARGPESPEGFWLDSYDHRQILDRLLLPLGPGGTRMYAPRIHDVATDALVVEPEVLAAPGTVVVVDGLFLHRRELEEHWDFTVFLDVPFEETCRRMALRDGSDPDPRSPTMRRYVGAQQIYYRERTPWDRADVVVDNTVPAEARVVGEDDQVPPAAEIHR